jgi:hypothetical protein
LGEEMNPATSFHGFGAKSANMAVAAIKPIDLLLTWFIVTQRDIFCSSHRKQLCCISFEIPGLTLEGADNGLSDFGQRFTVAAGRLRTKAELGPKLNVSF